MANVLPAERRLEVLAALVNGSGVRGAERMTGVHRDTIGRFAVAMGDGCARLHDRLVRDLECALVDMDEQHSWVRKRQQNLPAEGAPLDMGEQWTWAAICRTSKLVIAWTVGKRDQAHADELVADVRARLLVMPQITTDGLRLYESPILLNFGYAVPYMQTVKNYSAKGGNTPEGEKFAPKRGVDFITKRPVYGAPDPAKATTYAIERSNGTNRQWNARLNRRTLKFSKDLDRHKAAVALMYVYRNLCHVQRNMRITPAMAANVTDHIWELGELLEAALAEPDGEKPRAKPLVIPRPEGAARALPGDRGWLKVVKGGDAPAPAPPAAPTLEPAAAASPAVASGTLEPGGAEQLDLFAWRPKPAPPARPLPPVGAQLTLFDDA